jgi:hypothetical protein
MTCLIIYTIADANDYEYPVCTLFDTPLTTSRRILRDFLELQFDGAIYSRGSDDGLTAGEALHYLNQGKSVRIDDEQLLKSIGVCCPPEAHLEVLRRYL